MATICMDLGQQGQQQEQQQGQPYNSPGGLADHLAPETALRSKKVVDSHQSHFSRSDLIGAIFFHRKN